MIKNHDKIKIAIIYNKLMILKTIISRKIICYIILRIQKNSFHFNMPRCYLLWFMYWSNQFYILKFIREFIYDSRQTETNATNYLQSLFCL